MNNHGGKRKRSGRIAKHGVGVRHRKRDHISPNYPMHIDMKLVKGMASLRTKKIFRIFLRSIVKARKKGVNVLHFALLSNHFHLIVEANSINELARGMQSLNISFAKAINREFKRKGRVFDTRYFLSVLKTPLIVRNAYRYVLRNFANHMKRKEIFDLYSSIHIFKQIKKLFGPIKINIKCRFKDIEERNKHKLHIKYSLGNPKSILGNVWR